MELNNMEVLKKYSYEESCKLLREDIERLEKNKRIINKARGDVHKRGTDQAWDNTEFIYLEQAIESINSDIAERKLILKNVLVRMNMLDVVSEEAVNLGDILKLRISFSEEEMDELFVKLVAVSGYDSSSDYEETSIGSPLGMAIFGRKVGEQVLYKVGKSVCSVEILEKVKIDEMLNTSSYSRVLKK